MAKKYITKDSGKRLDFESGMKRDIQEGKPNFALCLSDIPYEEQLLTRWGHLMARGAEKYGRKNWQLACSKEELDRFLDSAFRHLVQYLTGEDDEDHAAAVLFNLNAAVHVEYKLKNGKVEKHTKKSK